MATAHEEVGGRGDFPNSTEYAQKAQNQRDFFRAVYKNDLSASTLLLKNPDININEINLSHKSALYLATENENMSMAMMLIKHGADINLLSYCNMYCSYETPIVTAARLHNVELVEMFLEEGSRLENDPCSSYKEGKTALHWASDFGDVNLAEMLIKRGADVNGKGPHLHTALHYATINDQHDMVNWLLDHGAKISANGDSRTPLHIAAVRGNFKIVKQVAEKTCIDVRDSFGFSPFSLSCLRGHTNIVDYLYNIVSDKSKVPLEDGLLTASENGHVEVMKFLLDKGVHVNKRNDGGESALSIACHGRHSQQDQLQAVKLLLENGAIINMVDSRGYTPLTISLMREQNDIAAMLIKHGASLDAVKPSSDSPLLIAFNTSNPLLVKYLLQAGCHFCREKWFNYEATKEKITEMDFHTPGPARFRRDSGVQKAAWEWIKERLHHPRTLSQLSRRQIRQHLSSVTEGRSVLKAIKKLPIPPRIETFLSLDEIDVLFES